MRRRDFITVIGGSVATFPLSSRPVRPQAPLANWTQFPARRTDGYATAPGVRLYFVRAGEGPLIVCLHGHPDNGSLYETLLDEFSRDHLVVAPNLRGCPPSDAPASVEAYAMPRLLGDLHGLLDHFVRKRCFLVGNDWGGYIAWVFASAYPSRVERLVIINSPHPSIFLRELRSSPDQIKASQHEREYNAAPYPYPLWYNYYRADPIKVPASIDEARSMAIPDLAASFFAGVERAPENTSLEVRVPALVIWGMNDATLLPGSLRGLEAYAHDLKIVRFANAGHLPMRTHSHAVNLTIREFLQ